jgi:26S proteasome regulatory subunit N5
MTQPCCVRAPQDTPSLAELKLLYYSLLIRYHEHANAYVDICRCYKAIYEACSL